MNGFISYGMLANGLFEAGATWPMAAGFAAGGLVVAGIVLLIVAIRARSRANAAERQPVSTVSIEAFDRLERQVQSLALQLDDLAGQVNMPARDIMKDRKGAPANPAGTDEGQYEPDANELAEQTSPAKLTEFGPLHQEIIRLGNQGLDPVEIARRVRRNVGEVELILNLFRQNAR